MSTAVKELVIGIVATVVGTLVAQWAINNVRAVRRTVGSI